MTCVAVLWAASKLIKKGKFLYTRYCEFSGEVSASNGIF